MYAQFYQMVSFTQASPDNPVRHCILKQIFLLKW